MTTAINTKDDQQVGAMALPQSNPSTQSSSTSTITTHDDAPMKTTNSDDKVSLVVMKDSTTTLRFTFSNPQPSMSVIKPMIKNKNPNNKRKTEFNDYEEPPKKRHIPNMQNKAAVVGSSIVEQDGPNIIASMIDHVKNTFKGYNDGVISDAKIIMEREINKTDINDDQGRLAIPKGKILTEFLNEEEVQLLSRKVNAINMATMDVKVIIGSNYYDMSLSRWNYKTEGGFKYVLKNKKGQWTKIKEDHKLDVRDMILVATFRHNNVLHFAIHKKRSTMLFGKKIEQYRMQ